MDFETDIDLDTDLGAAERPKPTTLTRRGFVGLAAAAATGLIGAGSASASASTSASTSGVLSWVNRHATPLASTDALGPLDDLWPLHRIACDAHLVGLGDSAQGTHTMVTLKHRVIRFLVERMGFRTVAWEENWGSGVAIDRYVVTGEGDARAAVEQAHILVHTEAFLGLVRWMREFNRGRPDHDKVRFLGADVVQMRAFLFDEITRYVLDVAPERAEDLRADLYPIRMRGEPGEHLAWYFDPTRTEDERHQLLAHARAVYDLVRQLPDGPSTITREDAVQHAYSLVGFYDMYTEVGKATDSRDHYMVGLIDAWRRRTGHRIVFGAHNAHVAAIPRMVITIPDGEPGDDTRERELSGGMLHRLYGSRFVSIGTVFHHGQVLCGWERHDVGPGVFDVPAPDPSFVDHTLGQAREPDYLLDLNTAAPPEVAHWLNGPATMRLISTAYDPTIDAEYAQTLDSWRTGFDAILHVNQVAAPRRLDA